MILRVGLAARSGGMKRDARDMSNFAQPWRTTSTLGRWRCCESVASRAELSASSAFLRVCGIRVLSESVPSRWLTVIHREIAASRVVQ